MPTHTPLKLNSSLPAIQQLQGSETIPGTNLSALPGLYGANPYLVNAKIRSFESLNSPSGNCDIGTPANGKRWAVLNTWFVNVSGGTITVLPQFKTSGNYYVISDKQIANNASQDAPVTNGWPVLESTDALSFNLSGAGLCLFITVIEFDAISEFKSPKILSTTSGNNTLYTCPSGCTAELLTAAAFGGFEGTDPSAALLLINTTGSSVNCYTNNVLNGGSVVPPGSTSSNSAQTAAKSVSSLTGGSTGLSLPGQALNAGDFINLNTASSGLTAWMWVIEHTQAA